MEDVRVTGARLLRDKTPGMVRTACGVSVLHGTEFKSEKSSLCRIKGLDAIASGGHWSWK